MDDSTICINRDLPGTCYSVVVEDNVRVAYGYLRHERNIIADVWLYNRCTSPDNPEWSDPSLAPFANPVAYAFEMDLNPIENERDVTVVWQEDPIVATVIIHGTRWAVLKSGAKPGFCRLAKKAGPLALPFE